jgi:ASC-1-like (ASCH) protein
MKLQSEPFGQIQSGTKKIEIRLFDEKRQKIHVGDTIFFSCMDNELDTIQTKVTDLVQFGTFKELFNGSVAKPHLPHKNIIPKHLILNFHSR